MKTNSLKHIFLTCLVGVATCNTAIAQTIASGAVTIDSVQTSVVNERVDVAAQWKSTGDVFFVSWYFVSLHYEHT